MKNNMFFEYFFRENFEILKSLKLFGLSLHRLQKFQIQNFLYNTPKTHLKPVTKTCKICQNFRVFFSKNREDDGRYDDFFTVCVQIESSIATDNLDTSVLLLDCPSVR